MNYQSLKLTKLDAARRQLTEAIVLFFEQRDPVAVHTLTGAAHQILTDLVKEKGNAGFLKNPSIIRQEKFKDWLSLINAPANFFKHADRDAQIEFEFKPAVTPMFILDSILLFQQFVDTLPHELLLYSTWFVVKHPDLLTQGPESDTIKAAAGKLDPDDFEVILAILKK